MYQIYKIKSNNFVF